MSLGSASEARGDFDLHGKQHVGALKAFNDAPGAKRKRFSSGGIGKPPTIIWHRSGRQGGKPIKVCRGGGAAHCRLSPGPIACWVRRIISIDLAGVGFCRKPTNVCASTPGMHRIRGRQDKATADGCRQTDSLENADAIAKQESSRWTTQASTHVASTGVFAGVNRHGRQTPHRGVPGPRWRRWHPSDGWDAGTSSIQNLT